MEEDMKLKTVDRYHGVLSKRMPASRYIDKYSSENLFKPFSDKTHRKSDIVANCIVHHNFQALQAFHYQ